MSHMTADGSGYTYTFDAENRVVAAAGATYSYDGNSLRVKRAAGSTTTVYIFSKGSVIAEYDNGAAPASPSREKIYVNGQLLAALSGATTTYRLADHLSARVFTDSSGAVIGQRGLFPFGEVWYETGTVDKWKFTSYERDAETGNDYALARYYVNRLGRFSATDPAACAHDRDPQNLNRYPYVANDPVNRSDPGGLFIQAIPPFWPCDPTSVECGCDPFTNPFCSSDPGGEFAIGVFLPGLFRKFADPCDCAKRHKNSLPACTQCCAVADTAHAATCGLLGLVDPLLGVVCAEESLKWAVDCRKDCADVVLGNPDACKGPFD